MEYIDHMGYECSVLAGFFLLIDEPGKKRPHNDGFII